MVRGKERQLELTGHGCDQQVELGQHPPRGAKLLKKRRKLGRGLFVGRPQLKDPQRRLQAGQVLSMTAAQAKAGTVFAEDG